LVKDDSDRESELDEESTNELDENDEPGKFAEYRNAW
jgi:hypothetical protein